MPHHRRYRTDFAGINASQDFVFISQLGEVYPCGFLPLSGGNIRRQSLADIYRDSLFFRRLRDSQNPEGKFLARKPQPVAV